GGQQKGSGKGWKTQGGKGGAPKTQTAKPWGGNRRFHDIKGGSGSGGTAAKRKGRGKAPVKKKHQSALAPAVRKVPKTVSYAANSTILVCGDGDFSFTRGLLKHRRSGAGVVATSLDSHDVVLSKYPDALEWLDRLADAKVLHGVDATRLEQAVRPQQLFDRVVFNFPHTGEQRVHLNRNLLRNFFRSARGYVKCAPDGGEVHVTLKEGPPYNGWEIKEAAAAAGMLPIRTLAFDPNQFPGYRHQVS
ncbi:hypothetical protein JKP88DRAFT_323304, partial [Tribonema minus]